MQDEYAHISEYRTWNDVYINIASIICALIRIHPGPTKWQEGLTDRLIDSDWRTLKSPSGTPWGDKFTLRNYTIVRWDMDNRRGGGTAIIIHKSIEYDIITTPHLLRAEACTIRLKLINRPVTLASVWNPPEDLEITDVDSLLQLTPTVIAAGDWNAKNQIWNCRTNTKAGRKLQNHWITSGNFEILAPDSPTYIPNAINKQPDILDITLDKNLSYTIKITIINELSSDHLPVKLEIALAP